MTTQNTNEGLAPQEQSEGMKLISQERFRQVMVEGYNAENDAKYSEGELAKAALAYEKAAKHEIETGNVCVKPPFVWPWSIKWWKPQGGVLRLLVKAGALYQAQADWRITHTKWAVEDLEKDLNEVDRVAGMIGEQLSPKASVPEYAYSYDEESFRGKFDSVEGALAEAFEEMDDERSVAFIGRVVPPIQPEELVDADTLIECVESTEEYSQEWAESWPRFSKEQREELTRDLRVMFAAWLDRHNNRPNFFTVVDVKEFTREDWEKMEAEGKQVGTLGEASLPADTKAGAGEEVQS